MRNKVANQIGSDESPECLQNAENNSSIHFIDSTEFRLDSAEELILGDPPVGREPNQVRVSDEEGDAYFRDLSRYPVLTDEQETYWFRKMNYLKYRATQSDSNVAATLLAEASDIRNFIVEHNLRLVVSLASKKNTCPTISMDDLISHGNVHLYHLVDRFDYMRGFKFVTYAYRSIISHFNAIFARQNRLRERECAFPSENFDPSDNSVGASPHILLAKQELEGMVPLFAHALLNTVEYSRDREIVEARFGFNGEIKTLKQLGEDYNLTKERVRQIENDVLTELKIVATLHSDSRIVEDYLL